jgi:hypothetical protein
MLRQIPELNEQEQREELRDLGKRALLSFPRTTDIAST